MPKQPQHGGSRPPVRKDDGRLRRKMVDGEDFTIRLPKAHTAQLRRLYGRNWQDVVRQLIETHLHAV